MTDGTSRSLFDRLAASLRDRRSRQPDRLQEAMRTSTTTRGMLIVAMLLSSVPVTIWAGAAWLVQDLRQQSARMEAEVAPWRGARRDRERAQRELAALVAMPRAAERVEQFARALDETDRIALIEREATGGVAAEILTADPARLRARLARIHGLPPLRTAGERQAEGALLVRVQAQ